MYITEVLKIKKDDIAELIKKYAPCSTRKCMLGVGPPVYGTETPKGKEDLKTFEKLLKECIFYRIFGSGGISKLTHVSPYKSVIESWVCPRYGVPVKDIEIELCH